MNASITRLSVLARSNIARLSTAELIELFNGLRADGTAEVKRFSDRKTAERRVLAVLPAAPTGVRPHDKVCPHCGDDASSITPAGKEGTSLGDNYLFCHACSTTWNIATGKVRKERAASANASAAIAASWTDPTVHEARITRHAVRVDGVDYKSVREAFEKLGLPMGRHIAFRKLLKAEIEINAFGKQWELIAP